VIVIAEIVLTVVRICQKVNNVTVLLWYGAE